MRQVTTQIIDSFMSGESKKISNSQTDGKSLYLFNNKIAEHREDGLYITNANWMSNTTKERLNGLPNVSIQQKKGKWYLNGNEWDGSWIKVNESAPPESKGEGKQFVLTTTWVSTDGWRGYSQPTYAVCGANDTGMWDDSPCRSDVAEKELNEAKAVLKRSKIPTKLMTTESSNVFCVHHYLVVPPYYHEDAINLVREHLRNTETNLLYIA